MIRTDFLPRVVDPAIVEEAFGAGRPAFEAPPRTMPMEFSVAAFRLGHSMVRAAYDLNAAANQELGLALELGLLFALSGAGGSLGGKAVLESNWVADLRRFYDFAEAGRPDLRLVASAPMEGSSPRRPAPGSIGSWPTRRRGCRAARGGAQRGVMRGVGGRLVAETFRRSMAESRISILRDPGFRPHLASPVRRRLPHPPPGTFRMVELLLTAAGGRAEGLNPLGDEP